MPHPPETVLAHAFFFLPTVLCSRKLERESDMHPSIHALFSFTVILISNTIINYANEETTFVQYANLLVTIVVHANLTCIRRASMQRL
jgi:hypothetical protein